MAARTNKKAPRNLYDVSIDLTIEAETEDEAWHMAETATANIEHMWESGLPAGASPPARIVSAYVSSLEEADIEE